MDRSELEEFEVLSALLEEADREMARLKPDAEVGRVVRSRLGSIESVAKLEALAAKLESAADAGGRGDQSYDTFRKRVDDVLRQWIQKPDGSPKEKWEDHGFTSLTITAYNRIDRSFCSNYVCAVRNGAYQPRRRRSISVRSKMPNARAGELEVALDHDSGATLCLEYQVKDAKGVPRVDRVGFALAIVLRAVHKDFRAFAIKID